MWDFPSIRNVLGIRKRGAVKERLFNTQVSTLGFILVLGLAESCDLVVEGLHHALDAEETPAGSELSAFCRG